MLTYSEFLNVLNTVLGYIPPADMSAELWNEFNADSEAFFKSYPHLAKHSYLFTAFIVSQPFNPCHTDTT